MADAHALLGSATHTEAWQDLPWKKFQKVVFRLQKRIYQAACMVPVPGAAEGEEPCEGTTFMHGSGAAGGGVTRLLTVTAMRAEK